MDVKRPLNNIPLHVKWWTVQYCTAVTGERPPVLNSTDLSIFINNHKLNSTLFHTIISNRCTQVMFTDNNYKITDMEIINYNHTLFKEKKKKKKFHFHTSQCFEILSLLPISLWFSWLPLSENIPILIQTLSFPA